jgi:hypothetical protein
MLQRFGPPVAFFGSDDHHWRYGDRALSLPLLEKIHP